MCICYIKLCCYPFANTKKGVHTVIFLLFLEEEEEEEKTLYKRTTYMVYVYEQLLDF